MNIALIGYGKMGRTIESLGRSEGHRFPVIIDVDNAGDLTTGKMKEAEVAIEFTGAEAAPGNIRACIDMGLPVVSGTTGWNDRMEEISEYCRSSGGAFFYASNYSIGVNILFELNKQLARIMRSFPSYRASIREIHHTQKKDAPSGTAISLAGQIVDAMDGLRDWSLERTDDPSSLPVQAIRRGGVKGNHCIRYDSQLDTLTLSHEAKTRDAFASGALLAAEFLRERKGVFGMEDLLKL